MSRQIETKNYGVAKMGIGPYISPIVITILGIFLIVPLITRYRESRAIFDEIGHDLQSGDPWWLWSSLVIGPLLLLFGLIAIISGGMR